MSDDIVVKVSGQSYTIPVGSTINIPVSNTTISSTSSASYLTSTGGFASTSTVGIFSSQPRIPCQHVTAQETAEYIDGTVYANCTLCAERIQIARLPGGLALMAAQSLVAALTLGVEDDSLRLLNELSDQLETNRQALKEFEGLVDIARRMVQESCG